ncbi:MAG: hypothetical protein M3155_05885 [Actinomycetota bacterium]|nr:hypothetical protein [Actinomycetota bacterium]
MGGPRYTEDDVRRAVAAARSLSEALRALGLRPAGGNHATLKRLISRLDLSTDHFERDWAQRARSGKTATPLSEILVAHSTYHRGHLKRRLFESGLKRPACELCGQGETWRGRTMALILDHVNGVPTDNRLANLRIVCPNCAATLDTHCGRKNAIVRPDRHCGHCGEPFRPRYERQRYCSRPCGSRHTRRRRSFPERRKVERPSYEQLVQDVRALGYLATGRRDGVSDNAIRKWLRAYERDGAAEPGSAGGAGRPAATIAR